LKILGIQYLIAFTITWMIGILLTYIINFVWVFKPDEKLKFRERLLKYILVYVLSYLINIGLLKILVQSYSFDPFWLQLFILPIVVLINFFGFKFWALKEEKEL
jgi:putative flippase GtrA